MFSKHKRSNKVDGELASIVRTNTVATFASMPTERLMDFADVYGESGNTFMLGCIGEAVTFRLVEIGREFSGLNIAMSRGEGRNFERRVGLLGLRTTCEQIQAFAQRRSDYLPTPF